MPTFLMSTIESNGDFGFELSDLAKPVTKQMLLEILHKNKKENEQNNTGNLFDQVRNENI
ncbi:hypothetical protein R4Z09_15070 [Niallia oryzisoli]|uniref:Uncharacterized protein n=1 Tax=Niallia oryzisoli TaxID=1737571 RepID=A0ABZ2CKJ2_9BACI